ncbi:MAG: type II toxin-antitoxin system Phd/YefM family antitoxin [Candidatus Sabulitectum sp.]|nr:type II toxin-antitoxin system Phd/YefM family antitoxin [Candidatus Sabulitectum sp.]
MGKNHWQLQDAKNKFSSLVEQAQLCEPQFVTKYGREVVVVLSIEEFNRITGPDTTLLNFFHSSPLAGIHMNFERTKETPRDVEL